MPSARREPKTSVGDDPARGVFQYDSPALRSSNPPQHGLGSSVNRLLFFQSRLGGTDFIPLPVEVDIHLNATSVTFLDPEGDLLWNSLRTAIPRKRCNGQVHPIQSSRDQQNDDCRCQPAFD